MCDSSLSSSAIKCDMNHELNERERYYYGRYYPNVLGRGLLYPSLKLELITISKWLFTDCLNTKNYDDKWA